eukprot:1932896-Prymnesium_polylepis.2
MRRRALAVSVCALLCEVERDVRRCVASQGDRAAHRPHRLQHVDHGVPDRCHVDAHDRVLELVAGVEPVERHDPHDVDGLVVANPDRVAKAEVWIPVLVEKPHDRQGTRVVGHLLHKPLWLQEDGVGHDLGEVIGADRDEEQVEPVIVLPLLDRVPLQLDRLGPAKHSARPH